MRHEWRERTIAAAARRSSEAPFRDLGDPLLALPASDHRRPGRRRGRDHARAVFSGWRRLLHNQRALYIKRLLLFEPRVILASVPYRLN